MNKSFVASVICAAVVGVGQARAQGVSGGGKAFDPILDKAPKPAYEFSVAYSPAGDFGSYGDSAMMEVNGDWAVGYFWDVLQGDIDVNARLRGLVFMDEAGALNLPSQLAQIALNAGWTWRFANQTAFLLRAYPGIYSDLEEADINIFYMPMSAAFVSSLGNGLSGILGMEARPGFDRPVMPIIGITWQPDPSLRIEAGVPESRCTYIFNDILSGHLGLDWRSTTFSVKDSNDIGRDRITIEDIHVYGGVEAKTSTQISFVADAGAIASRRVKSDAEEAGVEDSVKGDVVPFIRLGMKGTF